MKLTKLALTLVFGTLAATNLTTAVAGELDHVDAAPRGLVVRVDSNNSREVFKADLSNKVMTDAEASAAASQFTTEENRIAKLAPSSELDRATSSEAWYYWYAPTYYGNYYYSYYSYGYQWNYYPTYRWNWAGYSYYYYWY